MESEYDGVLDIRQDVIKALMDRGMRRVRTQSNRNCQGKLTKTLILDFGL